jgi:8-oxo-dGTP pyrophosphatase MutT (NUDIX family)
MKQTISVRLRHTFANLKRKKHVLVVPTLPSGKVIIGAKKRFYPKGIYRLISGGVEDNETPLQAAVRETKEEISLNVEQKDLKLLIEFFIKANVRDKQFNLKTYSYWFEVNKGNIYPGDDIDTVKRCNLDEFKRISERFYNIEKDNLFKGRKDYFHFWSDYGKVYGPIHLTIYQLLKEII